MIPAQKNIFFNQNNKRFVLKIPDNTFYKTEMMSKIETQVVNNSHVKENI